MHGMGMTTADRITRKHTAFLTFDELALAIALGYVPTVSRKRQASLLKMLRALQLPAFEVK